MVRFLLTRYTHPASESLIFEHMHAGRSFAGCPAPVCTGYASSLFCVQAGVTCRSRSSKARGGSDWDDDSPQPTMMSRSFEHWHDGVCPLRQDQRSRWSERSVTRFRAQVWIEL